MKEYIHLYSIKYTASKVPTSPGSSAQLRNWCFSCGECLSVY